MDGLNLAEERYRTVAEHTCDYAYELVVGPDGKYILTWESGAFAEVVGYPAEAMASFEARLACMQPEDRAALQARLDKMTGGWRGQPREGEPAQFDVRLVASSGEIRWVRDCAWPVWDAGEQCVVCIRGAGQDITERKRYEEQLAASEERLRTQYQHIPVPTYTWRRQGDSFVMLDYNDAARRISRGGVQNLVGKTAQEVFPDVPDIVADIERAYAERCTFSREMRHVLRTTGEPKQLAVSYAFVPPDEVLVHTEDITARVEAEAAASYQARLLRNVNDAVVATDAEGRITAWNQAAVDLYGWRAEEVLGLPVGQVVSARWLDPDEQAPVRSVRETGRMRAEALVTHRDGHTLTCEVTAVTLHDERGQVTGYVSVGRDITARRKAEAERDAMLATVRRQSQRLEILHDIDRAVLAAQRPADIAQAAVGRLRRAAGCERVSVGLFDLAAESIQLVAVDSAGPTTLTAGVAVPAHLYDLMRGHARPDGFGQVEDLAADPQATGVIRSLAQEGMRYYVTLPLLAGDDLLGGVSLWSASADAFVAENLGFARQVSDSLAIAIHNARLLEQVQLAHHQLQELSYRLVEVQENERRTIARELHDEAGQLLTALMLGLGVLEREDRHPTAMQARVRELKRTTEEVMEGIHRLAVNLRPASLDRLGLVPALRQYLESIQNQTGLALQFEAAGFDQQRLPAAVETALYRIVQEALTNVARHAEATQAGVALQLADNHVICIVEDNGQGFDPHEVAGQNRLGLLGMRERAEMLGGSLAIESAPNAGTTLFVDIPLGTGSSQVL